MQTPHLLRSFDAALDALLVASSGMAGSVAAMIADAGRAILDHDTALARRVVQQDLDVDRKFEDVRAQCLDVLTRFHPMAGDLRQVMAIEHAAGDLERAADHAKSIAKRVISGLEQGLSPEAAQLFARLHAAVVGALGDAVEAFATRDTTLASRVIRGDRKIDAIHDDLFHLVLGGAGQPGRAMVADVHLLFAAKSLERIGDHATNIAEEAMFMSKGEIPPATRPEG
ncbi:phosphate signaling complex protein PhoU (plasmid) [Cereibacter azotoformans]|uniref:phosphate signaling complex protein PhoU n=1 Tax=Cereibacter azotoformans TaxID=43057 RepID=UPI001EEA44ED|nr:phosphate signaling complex protein PhoU [Cereibacter azotoformans]ULB12488.1 phosphate signaling complex protein PhoU [Cereibacter azotoformans]